MLTKRILLIVFVLALGNTTIAQRRTENTNFRAPYKICFNNNTSRTVWVAVRYKTVNGSWRTKKWVKYRPYEKDRNSNKYVVKTYNRYFYYYARTQENYNGRYLVWDGTKNYRVIDGKRVGMKEVYLSKSTFRNPRGQKYYINLK